MSSRAFTGLLGVEESRSLLRAYGALRDLPAELQSTMLSAASQQLSAGWMEELNNGPAYTGEVSRTQHRIVTANPTAVARSTGLTVATGGTGPLGELTRAFEFGAINREEFVRYYRRDSTGAQRPVYRRTKRQMPSRSQTGWIAYPGARRLQTRVVAMYQQIIVKVGHDAVEGRNG